VECDADAAISAATLESSVAAGAEDAVDNKIPKPLGDLVCPEESTLDHSVTAKAAGAVDDKAPGT
jgi:hypothetical protein